MLGRWFGRDGWQTQPGVWVESHPIRADDFPAPDAVIDLFTPDAGTIIWSMGPDPATFVEFDSDGTFNFGFGDPDAEPFLGPSANGGLGDGNTWGVYYSWAGNVTYADGYPPFIPCGGTPLRVKLAGASTPPAVGFADMLFLLGGVTS